ncbi:MAG: rRNA maturation RNase YbeY [Chromatiales bacterium]|nr:rRNA maturation RNase YbeY [Chromatiales bacterium]
MKPQVHIQFASRACKPDNIPDLESFYQWAATVLDKSSEVGVRIVDNSESRQLNQYFRQLDRATNVLSFPFTTETPDQPNYLGDIVMAAPTIVLEAQQQDKPVLSHWAHLFIHALLHLQGYSHKTEASASVMEAQESKTMIALGFPDPWLSERYAIENR